MAKPTNLMSFLMSTVVGAVLWSSLLMAVGDPFDTLLYPLLLIALGAILAALNPRDTWRWALGVVVGEVAAFMVFVASGRGGPLWIVGLMYVLPFGLLVWAGSWIVVLFGRE